MKRTQSTKEKGQNQEGGNLCEQKTPKKRGRKPKIRRKPKSSSKTKKISDREKKVRNDQNFVPFVIRTFYAYLMNDENKKYIQQVYKNLDHYEQTKKELSRMRSQIRRNRKRSRTNMRKLFGNIKASTVQRNSFNRYMLRFIINQKSHQLLKDSELNPENYIDYQVKMRLLNYQLLDGDLMNFYEQRNV